MPSDWLKDLQRLARDLESGREVPVRSELDDAMDVMRGARARFEAARARRDGRRGLTLIQGDDDAA
jgi:SpoU rRNA methylase family enzyme